MSPLRTLVLVVAVVFFALSLNSLDLRIFGVGFDSAVWKKMDPLKKRSAVMCLLMLACSLFLMYLFVILS